MVVWCDVWLVDCSLGNNRTSCCWWPSSSEGCRNTGTITRLHHLRSDIDVIERTWVFGTELPGSVSLWRDLTERKTSLTASSLHAFYLTKSYFKLEKFMVLGDRQISWNTIRYPMSWQFGSGRNVCFWTRLSIILAYVLYTIELGVFLFIFYLF